MEREAPLDLQTAVPELIKDIQEELRQISRNQNLGDGDPSDPIHRIQMLERQVEGLKYGLVGRAREQNLPWAKVGAIFNIEPDTARHRYSESQITRRLKRLGRPRPPADDAGPGGSSPPVWEPADQAPVSVQSHTSPAYNRLSPVLSALARTSKLTGQTLADRVGCSSSYLSRVLSGDRVPTWTMTERFARACGADPAILRRVWETERLREKNPRPAHLPGQRERAGDQALATALRTLHVRAGLPTDTEIATATNWRLTDRAVERIMSGVDVPEEEDLLTLVHALSGDPAYFTELWKAAYAERRPVQPALAKAPTAPPALAAAGDPPSAVIEQFREVLASPLPLTSHQREHILQARRATVRTRFIERTGRPFPTEDH